MNSPKTKPTVKKYLKAGISFNIKKHKNLIFKVKKLRFFSPDFAYLKSKGSNKIEESYEISFLNHRKLKFLFGFPRTSLLKKFITQDLLKKKSSFFLKENEFCSLLELRLDFLLFRLGFVKTLYEAKHLIAYKKVFVNDNLNSSYTQRLKKGDVISFESEAKSLILKRLIGELANRDFFFSTFGNLEVNFKTSKIIVLTEKIKFSQQLHHYSVFLNWKSFLKG